MKQKELSPEKELLSQGDDLLLRIARFVRWLFAKRKLFLLLFVLELVGGYYLSDPRLYTIEVPISFSSRALYDPAEVKATLLALDWNQKKNGKIESVMLIIARDSVNFRDGRNTFYSLQVRLRHPLDTINRADSMQYWVDSVYRIFTQSRHFLERKQKTLEVLDSTMHYADNIFKRDKINITLSDVNMNTWYAFYQRKNDLKPFEVLSSGIYRKTTWLWSKRDVFVQALKFFCYECLALLLYHAIRFLYRYQGDPVLSKPRVAETEAEKIE